jgi:hypothetical protein
MLTKSIRLVSQSRNLIPRLYASTSNNDKVGPKKFERTPVGRLEDDETLKKKLNSEVEDDEETPKRRVKNLETGEIGGPRVSSFKYTFFK